MEIEKVEWRTCPGYDMLRFVAVDPEWKGQKGDDRRVCRS